MRIKSALPLVSFLSSLFGFAGKAFADYPIFSGGYGETEMDAVLSCVSQVENEFDICTTLGGTPSVSLWCSDSCVQLSNGWMCRFVGVCEGEV